MSSDLSSTAWQMVRTKKIIDIEPPYPTELGDPMCYKLAEIPFPNDARWTTAPTDATGRLELKEVSILPDGSCFKKLDFTYFRTYVNIPDGLVVQKFDATIARVDDGARMYLFNDLNPSGTFIPAQNGKLNGAKVTSDFKASATSGWNMVLIVQFDNCPVKNELTGGVTITVNDKNVPVDPKLPVPVVEFAPRRATMETYGIAGQGRTGDRYFVGWNAGSSAVGIVTMSDAKPSASKPYVFEVGTSKAPGGVALEVLNYHGSVEGKKHYLPDLGTDPTYYSVEPAVENDARLNIDDTSKFLSLKLTDTTEEKFLRHRGYVLYSESGDQTNTTYKQDCTWRFNPLPAAPTTT